MSWMRFAPGQWTNAHLKFCFGEGGLASKGVSFKTEVYLKVENFTFVVDVLVTPNIVVEIDGASHPRPRRQKKDVWKDGLLEQDGFKVYRYTEQQIKYEFENCVNQIVKEWEK